MSAVIQVVDSQTVVRAGENTLAIAAAVDAANAQIAQVQDLLETVQDAISPTFFTADVIVAQPTGVENGAYYAAISVPGTRTLTRFYGRVISGAGRTIVTLLINEMPALAPIEVNATSTIDVAVNIPVPSGADIEFLFENTDSTVTGVYVKAEGPPA